MFGYLINNLFKHGIFPDIEGGLNQAIILKKGNSNLMENYKPIILIPGLSKTVEMSIYVDK